MRCAVLLTTGLLILALTWFGPLPQLAQQAFFAHMTMHMAVVAVAAPLIAFGIRGTRLDPCAKAPWLFAAIPASVVELLVVWAWHAPGLHHSARRASVGFVAEQGMFLAAGLLVWVSSVGGTRPAVGGRRGAGIVALLLTSIHMTLLGALLALSSRPLYEHTDGEAFAGWEAGPLMAALCRPPERGGLGLGNLTALDDQHLGGAIMLLVGGVSYLLGGLWLTAGMLRDIENPRSEPA